MQSCTQFLSQVSCYFDCCMYISSYSCVDFIFLHAGRDRYDWATASDQEKEQVYCYPCGLLQQVATSSSPSWQDSSWSGSISLWAVLQVGFQHLHMILSQVKPCTKLSISITPYKFCCCEVIISDQGREFVNKVKKELLQLTGTEHCVTSAYHPQSNGLTERFNQTLQTALTKVVNETQDDWDEHLSSVLFAYRTAQQKATKMSPFEVMFCR